MRPRSTPPLPACFAACRASSKSSARPDGRTVQIALVLPYAPLLAVLAHPALSIVRPSPPGEGKAPFLGHGALRGRRDRARTRSCSTPGPGTGQAGRGSGASYSPRLPRRIASRGRPRRAGHSICSSPPARRRARPARVSDSRLAHRVPRPSDGERAVQPDEGATGRGRRARSGVDLARGRRPAVPLQGFLPTSVWGAARRRGDPRRQCRAREEALGGEWSPAGRLADAARRRRRQARPTWCGRARRSARRSPPRIFP